MVICMIKSNSSEAIFESKKGKQEKLQREKEKEL